MVHRKKSGCYCLKYHFSYYIILLIKRITDYKCSDHLLKEARQIVQDK